MAELLGRALDLSRGASTDDFLLAAIAAHQELSKAGGQR
ncbi:hypothetical protein BTZ20_2218 [Rhodococcus sp. MTM3W5.2]|nr:hypothetical protein BTZ20_2218 [Rhodococcus sp. MTM3W5.2]